MNAIRAAWLICQKDLRIELRTRDVLSTTSLFAVLLAVISSVAFFSDGATARRIAAGVLWITIAFAGILTMSRSWARERENEVLRALLLSPVPRSAIYAGKTLATLVFMVVVELIVVPLLALFFNLDLLRYGGPLAVVLAAGTMGFVATGNLFAALSLKTRLKDLALSVVFFPLVAPALLGAVVATRELFGNAELSEITGWIRILLAFDLLALAGGFTLFGTLIED